LALDAHALEGYIESEDWVELADCLGSVQGEAKELEGILEEVPEFLQALEDSI
jgi:septation ring formation regulator EzrA